MNWEAPRQIVGNSGKDLCNTSIITVKNRNDEDMDLFFSYQTLVAFKIPGQPPVVRKNDWSVTTGKHLNAIDDGNKKTRVDEAKFTELLEAQIHPGVKIAGRTPGARAICII